MSDSPQSDLMPLEEVFSAQDLAALTAHIKASGALGRSRVYEQLLDYLLDFAAHGRTPKEVDVAIDVLGRDARFDATRDSVVRVYIHQLRRKLARYYAAHAPEATHRLVIPKGQYGFMAAPVMTMPAPAASTPARRAWGVPVLLGLCLAALMANLLAPARWLPWQTRAEVPDAARHLPWSRLLDDEVPILLVMGDYYIFGELNELGNVSRMIRAFDINSPQDLNGLLMRNPQESAHYLDLDLNYMPEGSALAMARIVPLLEQSGKTVHVKMMSRLSTDDLRDNHIVYIGYLSALDKLSSLVFTASGLRIGRTYDELVNLSTGQLYSSDAGMPSGTDPFRDYGFFSTFPSSSSTEVVIVAGTRDAGLMHTAQAVVTPRTLQTIQERLPAADTGAFETLFEVFGFDRLNFDGHLIYSQALDPDRLWGNEFTRLQ